MKIALVSGTGGRDEKYSRPELQSIRSVVALEVPRLHVAEYMLEVIFAIANTRYYIIRLSMEIQYVCAFS
jgi:hypothetical protein